MANPILDVIQGRQLVRDHYGNLVELDEWSADIARELAASEGLDITDAHLRVLEFLRDQALNHEGLKLDAPRMLRVLEEGFQAEGGGRWLYELFPGGPARQGMRLAGLPPLPGAEDPSFGSVS